MLKNKRGNENAVETGSTRNTFSTFEEIESIKNRQPYVPQGQRRHGNVGWKDSSQKSYITTEYKMCSDLIPL